ncbi:MAG: hypothetical protein KQI62_05785 [Deltaproteobacteria bacterium]|nr:hypothetical protein [Deltaproteobacteria bacterium]
MAFANLHMHSFWSDGLLPAGEVLRLASQKPGLELIALTDHDTLSGLEPLFRGWRARQDLRLPTPQVAAGIELSLWEPVLEAAVHLLGYFSWLKPEDPSPSLARLEADLGAHCRKMTQKRGERDLDARVAKAHALNLDGLARIFPTPEAAVAAFRFASADRLRDTVRVEPKDGDVCQGPPPATYQDMIEAWSGLVPGTSRERVTLYTLRPDSSRVARLAAILAEEDGLPVAQARELALELQGCLVKDLGAPSFLPGPLEGLAMLQRAGAVTVLAHPGVDFPRMSLADFDQQVLEPMARAGLRGVEVFYPYDPGHRTKLQQHYYAQARRHGLLISGGTDFHGDGRAGLGETPLSLEDARRIVSPGLVVSN